MIHSNAPWTPSGYGAQLRLLLPKLVELGHEPVVSAFQGLHGSPINWKDYLVLPGGEMNFSPDVIGAHADNYGVDLILTLMDFWQLGPAVRDLRRHKVAAWLPNDCAPLGRPDQSVLQMSGATPIAMSQFGLDNLRRAGFHNTMYAPHAVDMKIFRPPADRTELRRELGVDDRFVVGICSANRDVTRKAFPEQFAAFAAFHKRNPDSLLMVHTIPQGRGGLDLIQLARDMEIDRAVLFSDPYGQLVGLMEPFMMADWFGHLDVLSNCTYAEGFGIPIIEAQACGTPVISTDASAMTEITRFHLVRGHPYWNPVHQAWWNRPDVTAIENAYQRAYDRKGTGALNTDRKRALEFVAGYDADTVARLYWGPLLETLAEQTENPADSHQVDSEPGESLDDQVN